MTVPGEEREAFRLLRRLASSRTMARIGDGGTCVPGTPGGRTSAIATGAENPLVQSLLRRGLIAQSADGTLALTGEGRAFVRRGMAPDDAFAAQHQTRGLVSLDDPELGSRSVAANLDESPLAWLRRHRGRDGRPLIDAAEFTAGERLRSDFTRARMMPRITANWTASIAERRRDGTAGAAAELTEVAIEAKGRVRRALDFVGPDFAGILVDFCCFLKSVEEIEKSRAWPSRSAKVVLRLALSSLARHYGLSGTARGRTHGPLRHWGTEDYRPSVE
jgi:hypothetical protein